jgi:hypothetical protein
MNPWLEALLWGALGLVVAMTVALLVTTVTRAPADRARKRRGTPGTGDTREHPPR